MQHNRLFAAREFDRADAEYEAALHALPPRGSDDFAALRKTLQLNICACAIEKKDYARAIEFATRVLDAEPSNAKALRRRGSAHLRRGDGADALHDLTRAQAAAPDEGLAALVAEARRLYDDTQRKERAFAAKAFDLWARLPRHAAQSRHPTDSFVRTAQPQSQQPL